MKNFKKLLLSALITLALSVNIVQAENSQSSYSPFAIFGSSIKAKLSSWILDMQNSSIVNVGYQLFDINNTPATNAEGLLQWNATDGTLDLGMSGGDISMQIGQEMFTKVRNESGYETINNGQAVYISGRTGVFPDVRKARSDSESTSTILGIATQDIASPSYGFITTIGYVRGIKTNYTGTGIWGTTWVTNDKLYVSKTNAGVLTNVEPSPPHHSDIVGTVGVISATQGTILVTNQKHKTLAELTDVNGTPLTVTGQMPVWNQTAGYFDFDYNITNYLLKSGSIGDITTRDHHLLTGLTDDDHTQYALLAGRAGGQTLKGGTGVTDILKIQGTSGNGTLTSPAIQGLVGNNGATTAFTVLNNGNFLIGRTTDITNFAGNLQVTDTDTFSPGAGGGANPTVSIWSSTTAAVGKGATLLLGGKTGNGIADYAFGAIRGEKTVSAGTGNYSGALAFYSTNAGGFFYEGARLDWNGNFGIGQTSPDAKLHLKTASTGSNKILNIEFPNFVNSGGYISFTGTNAGEYGRIEHVIDGTTTSLRFYTYAGGTAERMRIHGKNVGIGVISPTAYLHLAAGTATSGTAPIKFTSGTLLTTPEAGVMEFLTDKFYLTDTSGTTRSEIKVVDKYFGEMYEYENTTATVIGTQGIYHAVNNFMESHSSGFTFVAGLDGTGTITDYSGTVAWTVLFTDMAHGLLTGDIITIHSSTDYNGTFNVTKVDDNSFYFTATYTSDQTADWAMGSYLLAASGSDGDYEVNFNLTAFTSAANLRFKFELNQNTTDLDNTANSRVFSTATDYGSISGGGLITVTAGDRIWLSTRNESSNQDITVRHCNVRIKRL